MLTERIRKKNIFTPTYTYPKLFESKISLISEKPKTRGTLNKLI